ncbi:MAG: SUMF1/EgtB/PvdO family nonheme iron enzyme [Pseudomonadota bacterium]
MTWRRAALVAAGLALCHGAAGEDATIDWVSIQGGCFTMGQARTYAEEAPPHEACVAPFDLARTEVTNAQFRAFVDATGYVTRAERGWQAGDPDGPGAAMPPGSAVFAPPATGPVEALAWWQFLPGASWRQPFGEAGAAGEAARADHPVVHVTRADAEAFAAWAGGRLPSEAEWELAARGGVEGALMAWDAEADADRPAQANTWQGIFPMVNVRADGFAGTAPVARFPANGFGLFDMVGNVWEWTAGPYTPSHAGADRARAGANGLDPTQPGVPVGTIKGGSFLCAPSYCFRFRPAARQAQDLAFGTSHIGFRIARSADSASAPEDAPQ